MHLKTSLGVYLREKKFSFMRKALQLTGLDKK